MDVRIAYPTTSSPPASVRYCSPLSYNANPLDPLRPPKSRLPIPYNLYAPAQAPTNSHSYTRYAHLSFKAMSCIFLPSLLVDVSYQVVNLIIMTFVVSTFIFLFLFLQPQAHLVAVPIHHATYALYIFVSSGLALEKHS